MGNQVCPCQPHVLKLPLNRKSHRAPVAAPVAGLSLMLFLGVQRAPLAAAPATAPGSPATRPSTQPVPSQSLANGQIRFAPPPDDWVEATKSRRPTAAAYVSADHLGAIAIEVLPTDADVEPKTADLIVRKLRQGRRQSHATIVMEPTLERDDNANIRIHEKYRAADKIADVLHLYRKVGPRVVMVTVSALSDTPEAVQAIHDAGQQVSRSTTFVKPVKKGK